MPERELLGQGVVELLLDAAKLKPAIVQAKQLIESMLGGVGGSGQGGPDVFKGMANKAKLQAKKSVAAIDAELAKGGKKGIPLEALIHGYSKTSDALEEVTEKTHNGRDALGRFVKQGDKVPTVAKNVRQVGMSLRIVSGSARVMARGMGAGMSLAYRGVKRLTRAVFGLGGAFRKTKSQGLGFGGMLAAVAGGNILANVITKITGRLKGMIAKGWQSAAAMETMKISFEKLVGSKKEADALLDTLTEFANMTPLDNQQIMKAATSLMATKKIANDQLLPTLEKLADAAAGSSEGFESFPRVVRGISQMMTKGKVSAEEMMQLAEAGVPAWSALATAMGKSQEEVMAMSSQGKLGVEAISKLVEGLGTQYEGLAAKQAGTWQGLMSTVKGVSMGIMRGILKPVLELGKVNLSNLIEWMQGDKAKAYFAMITKAVTFVTKLIDKGLKSPLMRTIAIVGGVAVAFTGLAAGAIAAGGMIMSVLNPVVLIIGGLAAGVAALALSFKAALASDKGKEIIKTLGKMKELIYEIGGNLRDGLLTVWEKVKEAVGSVFKMDTGSFWLKAVNGAHSFLDVLSLLTSDWSATWDLMKASMWLSLQKMYDKAATVVEKIRWVFAVGIGGVVGLFTAWVSQIKAFFLEVGNMASATASGMSAVFKEVWENPSKLFNATALATAFADKFQAALASQKQPDYLNYGEAMNAEASKWGNAVKAMSDRAREARADAIAETEKQMTDAIDRMSKTRDDKRQKKASEAAGLAAVQASMLGMMLMGSKNTEKKAEEGSTIADAIKESSAQYSKTSLTGLHDAVQASLMGDPNLDEAKKQTDVLEDIRDSVKDQRDKLSKDYAAGKIGMDEYREEWEKLSDKTKKKESPTEAAKRRIAETLGPSMSQAISPAMQEAKRRAAAAEESSRRISEFQSREDPAAADSHSRIEQLKQQAEEAAMASAMESKQRIQQRKAEKMGLDPSLAIASIGKGANPKDERPVVEVQKSILGELKKQTDSNERLVGTFQNTSEKLVNSIGFGE